MIIDIMTYTFQNDLIIGGPGFPNTKVSPRVQGLLEEIAMELNDTKSDLKISLAPEAMKIDSQNDPLSLEVASGSTSSAKSNNALKRSLDDGKYLRTFKKRG